MALPQVEVGSPLAQAIQNAVQPKLIESGWVLEENDTTLSEYVTMMLVQQKDIQGVRSELGGDLLGLGEDDPGVVEFSDWLFAQVQSMVAPAQQAPAVEAQQAAQQGGQVEEQQQQQGMAASLDSTMDDAAPAVGEGVPSGPKAMRDGTAVRGRGRGGRMLGQMNNHMNREQASDPLRRIKGAAGGQHGRIDAHAGRDAPRGPRGSRGATNGVQRMMNGRGGSQMNAMLQQQQQQPNMMSQMGGMDPQHQMAFMQMMMEQANMMQQFVQNGGQMPGAQGPPAGTGRPLSDRINKRGGFKGRQQQQQRPTEDQGDSAQGDMEVDRKPPFDTECRFNLKCTNPTCHFAHQSPAAPPGITLDMNDTCDFGPACENRKCAGRHPSPAQRQQHKLEVDCKFAPHCTNPSCAFRHPEMPACRNGADCKAPGCAFTHSQIMCRYTPCTKPNCPFKHTEGQKGVFKDKVWTPGNGEHRLAPFSENQGEKEELIIPEQQNPALQNGDAATAAAQDIVA